MSKKVILDGRPDSRYGKVTAWMRKVQVYTRKQIEEKCMEFGSVDIAHAKYDTNILLSPRVYPAVSRGDPVGAISNPWGHQAYNERLTKVPGEKQKYRFRIRPVELAPAVRTIKVANQKKSKTVKAVEVKANKVQVEA